ncbi:BREX-3 system P-loop-containing protein BrxF [Hydrogenophilus thiooxidans]|uniref:BREX-3 system P-loop-containing protein BrxF n=1 Tax=Hydrogenophilus thiooxidans TaxID=2820326 RepID=UPI001C24B7C6|nr:BREX-3 system P-loop-containing protein BrxF [Hydrogenophilus thiooxidans]
MWPARSEIKKRIDQVQALYFRLVLLVGRAQTGKTAVLQAIAAEFSTPLINVNLELSRRMLDLTERQRALLTQKLLDEIVRAVPGELVLLDNIEILFDVHLQHDPMRLLQGLSRNKSVVAAWNGSIAGGDIIYAALGHPEYRRYPIRDFLVITPDANTDRPER